MPLAAAEKPARCRVANVIPCRQRWRRRCGAWTSRPTSFSRTLISRGVCRRSIRSSSMVKTIPQGGPLHWGQAKWPPVPNLPRERPLVFRLWAGEPFPLLDDLRGDIDDGKGCGQAAPDLAFLDGGTKQLDRYSQYVACACLQGLFRQTASSVLVLREVGGHGVIAALRCPRSRHPRAPH